MSRDAANKQTIRLVDVMFDCGHCMKSLTKEKRYDLIDALNSTSRCLDDLLNIDNIHFEHMVHGIYPAELQLNKANASDTEAAF